MSGVKCYSSRNIPNVGPMTQPFCTTKTILIAEGKEYEIDNVYAQKSPYLKTIRSKLTDKEELKIIMPKWVTIPALDYVVTYMKIGKLMDITFNEGLMQKLLWLSDFLHLAEFQMKFIKEKIIPQLTSSNSLLFLTESFKKLKGADDSNDAWYVLFNYTMNLTAKNLLWNKLNKRKELLEVNEKILEEIIERALKYQKHMLYADQRDIIELLIHTRKTENVFDLLEKQRQVILLKKFVNVASHPNITWKLRNIMKITEKETHFFKFGSFVWRLEVKMVKDANNKSSLKFLLKFDNQKGAASNMERDSENRSPHKNSEFDCGKENDPQKGFAEVTEMKSVTEGILTIYYQMKVNNGTIHKETQIQSLNIDKCPSLLLKQFSYEELVPLSTLENEFVVYLNLELGYSAILTHIAKNIESYYQDEKSSMLSVSDLCAILRSIPRTSTSQECGLSLSINWMQIKNNSQECLSILNCVDWDCISTTSLIKITNFDAYHKIPILRTHIENQLTKKTTPPSSSSAENGQIPKSLKAESVYSERQAPRPLQEARPLQENMNQLNIQGPQIRGRAYNMVQNDTSQGLEEKGNALVFNLHADSKMFTTINESVLYSTVDENRYNSATSPEPSFILNGNNSSRTLRGLATCTEPLNGNNRLSLVRSANISLLQNTSMLNTCTGESFIEQRLSNPNSLMCSPQLKALAPRLTNTEENSFQSPYGRINTLFNPEMTTGIMYSPPPQPLSSRTTINGPIERYTSGTGTSFSTQPDINTPTQSGSSLMRTSGFEGTGTVEDKRSGVAGAANKPRILKGAQSPSQRSLSSSQSGGGGGSGLKFRTGNFEYRSHTMHMQHPVLTVKVNMESGHVRKDSQSQSMNGLDSQSSTPKENSNYHSQQEYGKKKVLSQAQALGFQLQVQSLGGQTQVDKKKESEKAMSVSSPLQAKMALLHSLKSQLGEKTKMQQQQQQQEQLEVEFERVKSQQHQLEAEKTKTQQQEGDRVKAQILKQLQQQQQHQQGERLKAQQQQKQQEGERVKLHLQQEGRIATVDNVDIKQLLKLDKESFKKEIFKSIHIERFLHVPLPNIF